MLFESFEDIKLDDIYRALDYYTKYGAEFQVWLYDHSAPLYKRNIRTTYFDCTNYYYDISKPDIDELDEDGNILKKRDTESMVRKRITERTRSSRWDC